jgi:CubicO group peptidase (beta-lactamase class C family)
MAIMRSAGALLAASLICGAGVQFSVPAWGEAALSCGTPLEADGDWPTASPKEAGLDPTILCPLNEALDKSPEMNVHAVLVVRGGKLVYETYRAGEDQEWGKKLGVTSHTPQMQHDLRSISKSVVSLLFGIALDRKLIASIDEPVFTYFPEYADLRTPDKDRILLRHLLAMRSGLAWNESAPYSDPTNSENMMIRSEDPYHFVLEQRVWSEPDEEWNYSGGDVQLLAGVLQKATGKLLEEFAEEALFEPLGITQFEWKYMPSGEVAAASGLRLRPRDLAKLGELCSARACGTAVVSFRKSGSRNQPERGRWMAPLRLSVVGGGRNDHWRPGHVLDLRAGLWRPAHLHCSRIRPRRRYHGRPLRVRPSGAG